MDSKVKSAFLITIGVVAALLVANVALSVAGKAVSGYAAVL